MAGSAACCLAYIVVAWEIMGRMTGGALKGICNAVIYIALSRGITTAMTGGAGAGTISRRIMDGLNARFHAV